VLRRGLAAVGGRWSAARDGNRYGSRYVRDCGKRNCEEDPAVDAGGNRRDRVAHRIRPTLFVVVIMPVVVAGDMNEAAVLVEVLKRVDERALPGGKERRGEDQPQEAGEDQAGNGAVVTSRRRRR